MLSTLLQACDVRVRVLQNAIFLTPPFRRHPVGTGDEPDWAYLTDSPPPASDAELVRGVVEVSVPSDRFVSQIRVRLRADQVVSILDLAAVTVPVSWEQTAVFDRTLVYPPNCDHPGLRSRSQMQASSARPKSRSRSRTPAYDGNCASSSRTGSQAPLVGRGRPSSSTDRRSRSAIRSMVHPPRSRSRGVLGDVAELESDAEPRGRTGPSSAHSSRPRSPDGHSQIRSQSRSRSRSLTPSRTRSRSRGRSAAVRPATTGLTALIQTATSARRYPSVPLEPRLVDDDAYSPSLSPSPFPTHLAPSSPGQPATPITPAVEPSTSMIRSASAGMRSLSLNRLRMGLSSNRGGEDRSIPIVSQRGRSEMRRRGRDSSLSRPSLDFTWGARDPSASRERDTSVRDRSDSASEEENEGMMLTKGEHAFEFSFIMPSDAPPYERSSFGRVKWTIKATVVGGGRARSNAEDVAEVYPIVIPTPDHFFATPLSILYHDLHPTVGLLSLSLTSNSVSVGGVVHIEVQSPQPPPDLAVYLCRVTLETTIELTTRRRGRQKVPVQRHRLYESGWVPPKPGSIKPGEGDPTQGPIRLPGSHEPWGLDAMVRLPDDNTIRATTMPGSRASIRFSHALLVEIVHSRDAANDPERPPEMPEDERKIKVFALRQAVILPSCCVAYNAVTLPLYAHHDPLEGVEARPQLNPHGKNEHARCVCGLTLDELVAQQEALVAKPVSVARPTDRKPGELPPDWSTNLSIYSNSRSTDDQESLICSLPSNPPLYGSLNFDYSSV